jgi:NAD(P)-dependent dehydrogenase (short-subunit alcohol dehydrogenase family)
MIAKRVLITGASGLLGRQLALEFAESGWEVLGLAFSRATGKVKPSICACAHNRHQHTN